MELMDERGRVLARGRVPEGVAGMARLHELIGEQLGEDADDAEVVIGTETDRGPWVGALVAAGYTVYGVNPLQASRYRERHGVSGAKSDRGDAHMLTDMVRTDSHQLRAFQEVCHPVSAYLEKVPTAQLTRIGAADRPFSVSLTRITSVPECAVSSVGFLWGSGTMSRRCGVSVGLAEASGWPGRPLWSTQVPRLPNPDDHFPGNSALPERPARLW